MPTPPAGARTAVKQTTGGFYSASIFSGALAPGLGGAPGSVAVGPDVLLYSGAGRLDTVLVHQNTASSGYRLPIVFYDASAPVSGGPVPTSGHRVIAFSPAFISTSGGVYGATSGSAVGYPITWGMPVQIGAPFLSGLCFNSRSGQPGVTVSWTPEANFGQV